MNEVKRGTLHEIKPVIRIFRLRFHLSPPSFLSGVSDRSTKINVFEPASFLANGFSVNTYGLLKQTSHRQLGSPSTCLISSSIVFHLGSCADAYGFNLQTVFVHVEACLRSSSLMNVRVLLAIAPGSEVASILMVNPLGPRFLSMYQRLAVGEGVVDILAMD
jgi:hypothetical protein